MHKMNVLETIFRHYLAVVILSLAKDHTALQTQHFTEARDMLEEDVKKMSVLELCLVRMLFLPRYQDLSQFTQARLQSLLHKPSWLRRNN